MTKKLTLCKFYENNRIFHKKLYNIPLNDKILAFSFLFFFKQKNFLKILIIN